MISLETAKALKDAGLEWEPKLGDLFNTLECIEAGNTSFGIWDEEIQEAYDTPGADIDGMRKGSLWLPRLDQLLAEIRLRGYGYTLRSNDDIGIYNNFPYECNIRNLNKSSQVNDEYGDSPEEAAAQALLWILRKEVR